MAIESACIPLPSEIIMPLSGWMLIRDRGLGEAFVLVAGFYGALGNVIGSLVAYWVGAVGGRPLILRYGRYIFVSRYDLERADRWFERYGDWAIFFSRLLPVVRTFISFPAGVARMPLGKFIIYTMVGSYPWSVGLAYGGYLLGENWEELRGIMRPFDIPILFLTLVLIIFFVYRKLRSTVAEAKGPDL
ncbi:MAG: DedA family protein [Chloroflexi bacterium]|nr:DedA family protein [Chloroflexota bacterium]